jgi:hypothetical protein
LRGAGSLRKIHDTLVLLLQVENNILFEKRVAVSMEYLPECSTKYTYYAIYRSY